MNAPAVNTDMEKLLRNIKENRISLAVIGGGPAGLAAAAAAAENGLDPERILVLERDSALGGILNQCVHPGFGLRYFGTELTGPEYAGRFIEKVRALSIPCLTDAAVLSLVKDRSLSFVSPATGFCRIRPEAVVLAMGCRERTRGALNIPGTRPAGVYTAGSAQRLINLEGGMPGKKVVILGSGDIGLIMARRLTLEGAEVLCVCEVMPSPGGLARNIAQCLDDFGIPLYLSTTVTKISGAKRVNAVEIASVDENRKPIPGTERVIECDTLLLSVGLIPENELARGAEVPLDPVTGGADVDQFCASEIEGIFACGNALTVHDLVDDVSEESARAGKAAALRCLGKTESVKAEYAVRAGENVRFLVPQRVSVTENGGDVSLSFRAAAAMKNVCVRVLCGEKVLKEKKRPAVTPGETEHIPLPLGEVTGEITVECLPPEVETK